MHTSTQCNYKMCFLSNSSIKSKREILETASDLLHYKSNPKWSQNLVLEIHQVKLICHIVEFTKSLVAVFWLFYIYELACQCASMYAAYLPPFQMEFGNTISETTRLANWENSCWESTVEGASNSNRISRVMKLHAQHREECNQKLFAFMQYAYIFNTHGLKGIKWVMKAVVVLWVSIRTALASSCSGHISPSHVAWVWG